MRKSIIFLLIFPSILFSLVWFTSCEKIIKMDIKDDSRKITANCLFTVGQPIQVYVSKSLHILDNSDIPGISDATVVLYSDNVLIDTLTNMQDGNYFCFSHLAERGKNYSIKVTAPELKEVTAFDYIPSNVSIIRLDTSTVMYTEGSGSNATEIPKLKCIVRFADPQAETNFYCLKVFTTENYMGGNNNILPICEDPIVEEFSMHDGMIFSDEAINGKEYAITFLIDKYSSNTFVSLNSLTKNNYLYTKSLSKYVNTIGDFFAEPVHVYSNISNGFGIFAGYSSSTRPLN